MTQGDGLRVGSWALAVCGFVSAVSVGCHHQPPSLSQQTSGPAKTIAVGDSTDARTRRDFDRRIAAYVSLREGLARTLGTEVDPRPGATDAKQTALRGLIAKARANAKPGDLFDPAMQTSVRGIVRRLLDGPNGTSIRASLMDENPVWADMQINSGYPVAIPVSTMPAVLLLALPALADGLEFHFVGSRLVLLDTRAWMIVDFVEYVLK